MAVKWIVENFTDSEDYRDLIQAIKNSGRYVFVIGKHNHFDFDPSGFVEDDCVVVQGSIQMVNNIRDRLPKGCFPVAYNTWSNYLCSSYYEPLKDYLFNDKHSFVTVGELKSDKFKYYEKYGKEALIFIRPDSGEKSFSGQLLDLQDFDKFWNNSIASSALDTDIIVVSTPKNIVGEWRFVCSSYYPNSNTYGGEIIAQSTYQYQGQRTLIPSAPFGATELCLNILDGRYYPDSIFCIDICQDSDGNYWLLELTSFSSAGLYATDKAAIVKRVNEITELSHRIFQLS